MTAAATFSGFAHRQLGAVRMAVAVLTGHRCPVLLTAFATRVIYRRELGDNGRGPTEMQAQLRQGERRSPIGRLARTERRSPCRS